MQNFQLDIFGLSNTRPNRYTLKYSHLANKALYLESVTAVGHNSELKNHVTIGRPKKKL